MNKKISIWKLLNQTTHNIYSIMKLVYHTASNCLYNFSRLKNFKYKPDVYDIYILSPQKTNLDNTNWRHRVVDFKIIKTICNRIEIKRSILQHASTTKNF